MFLALCQLQPSKFPYKSPNPLHQNSDLFFCCDPPHLLKTARNCFSNSFAHSKSRKLMVHVTLYVYMYVSIYRHNTFVNIHTSGAQLTEKWTVHQLEVDRTSLFDRNFYRLFWYSSLSQVNQGPCLVDIAHQNESTSCSSGRHSV